MSPSAAIVEEWSDDEDESTSPVKTEPVVENDDIPEPGGENMAPEIEFEGKLFFENLFNFYAPFSMLLCSFVCQKLGTSIRCLLFLFLHSERG